VKLGRCTHTDALCVRPEHHVRIENRHERVEVAGLRRGEKGFDDLAVPRAIRMIR